MEAAYYANCLQEAVEILIALGFDIAPLAIVERFPGTKSFWSDHVSPGGIFQYCFVLRDDPSLNVASFLECMSSCPQHGTLPLHGTPPGSGRVYGIPVKETYDISYLIERAHDRTPLLCFPD